MNEVLRRALEPLRERIRTMIGRCVLAAVNDSGELQVAQVTLNERTLDDVERFGEWGLISVPPVGADGVLVFLGESASHGVLVGVESPAHRPRGGEPGESGLHTTDGTTTIRVKPDGTVTVRGAGKVRLDSDDDVEVVSATKVRDEAPELEAEGSVSAKVSAPSVEVTGDISVVIQGLAVTVTGTTIQLQGTVSLGGGSLQRLIDQRFKALFDSHTHPVFGGPNTGAPNEQIDLDDHATTTTTAS